MIKLAFVQFFRIKADFNRVGSHVVLAWIHCTEKWPLRGRKAILVKCKQRFFFVFSSIPRNLYTIFQPTFFLTKLYQDILSKLLTLSTDLNTIFSTARVESEMPK